MTDKIKVAVLVSTYNGQQFVTDQIDSIFSQNIDQQAVQIQVYVRDDSSTDHTLAVLTDLKKKYSSALTIMGHRNENVGVKRSFFALVDNEMIDADYYFLADQDDIWETNKVARMLQEFQKYPVDEPVGIYSDLWVADANGKSLGKRMSQQARWPQNVKVDYRFLATDYRVTGAAFAFNKTARELFMRIPDNFIPLINMHDSFFALIVSVCGKLVQIDEPLVRYRQHGTNLIGALRKKRSFIERIKYLAGEQGQLIVDNVLLSAFLSRNHIKVAEEQQQILGLYLKYNQGAQNIWHRCRNGFQIARIAHKRAMMTFLLITLFNVIKIVDPNDSMQTILSEKEKAYSHQSIN